MNFHESLVDLVMVSASCTHFNLFFSFNDPSSLVVQVTHSYSVEVVSAQSDDHSFVLTSLLLSFCVHASLDSKCPSFYLFSQILEENK